MNLFCSFYSIIIGNVKTPQNRKQELRLMKLKTFFFILISVTVSTVTAHNQALTEEEDNLYWQPNVEIDYSHFL